MQNLRGIFLSKEERERQGLTKKGEVMFSCALLCSSIFMVANR